MVVDPPDSRTALQIRPRAKDVYSRSWMERRRRRRPQNVCDNRSTCRSVDGLYEAGGRNSPKAQAQQLTAAFLSPEYLPVSAARDVQRCFIHRCRSDVKEESDWQGWQQACWVQVVAHRSGLTLWPGLPPGIAAQLHKPCRRLV